MTPSPRSRCAITVAVLSALVLGSSGCSLFSSSKAPPPEVLAPQSGPAPTAVPASPPPSLRAAGARIADEEMLKRLVQGKTTNAEAREMFGVPQEVVLSPGIETLIYYRDVTSGWFTRTVNRVEMLTLRFDDKGFLKDFEYRYSGK